MVFLGCTSADFIMSVCFCHHYWNVYCKNHLVHLHINVSCWHWHGEVFEFNTLRPGQNGCHFTDDVFKRIFLNENVWISLKFHWNLFLRFQLTIFHPALVQIMAWRRPGDKPLSEPMMVCLMTHICVIWPQWVKLIMIIWYQMYFVCNKPVLCF